jgi:Fe-coproporphyrin III synthase
MTRMIETWRHKVIEGVTHPEKIRPFIGDRIRTVVSHVGDGAWAMKPQTIKLYVNAVCNARCVMCDIGQNNHQSVFYKQVAADSKSVLSVEDCRRLMSEVRGFRPQINIHGLEPLLHANIFGIIEAIKNGGSKIHLVTNGILLPEKAEELIRIGVDIITVSVDGPRDIHNAIRGKGCFEKAMEGIKLLTQWRKRLRRNEIKLTSAFTISNLNDHCLQAYAHMMLEEVQIDAVNFLFLSFVTENASRLHNDLFCGWAGASAVNLKAVAPATIDASALWDQISYLRRRYRYGRLNFNHAVSSKKELEVFLKHPDNLLTSRRCTIPWKSATILSNGNVIINNRCFFYVAGNIHQAPLMSIWNGKRYRDFRRRLKKTGFFPACFRCCGTYCAG